MRSLDVCTALLVTTGNRALREPSMVSWEAIEDFMSIGLRAESRMYSRVTVLDEHGGRRSFQEWLSALASPQARLWFAPGPWETDPQGDSAELPAHIREAFLGGGGWGLLLFTDGPRSERFMPREVRPRLYEISGRQLFEFYRGRKRADAWEEALKREFAPELQGRSVRAFLESRSLDDMQEVIQRFMPLSVDVEPVGEGHEVDTDETVKWNLFFSPAPGSTSLSFEYLPVGPGEAASAERDLSRCRAALASALEAVRTFADKQDLKYWSKHFRRCLLRLSLEPQPLEDLLELLLTHKLPVPAVQLANAAMASDVFGGMGSWNDLGFDGPDAQVYQELSNRLLQAMKSAFRAAINSSAA
ncbi:hypothetical protein [Hyalangium minutum]|uniref:Uncharacterized protein n=1 Tax=Hyalangium minutum TaxID=394096 RepID=A0A085W064_9BACT|nr:hypothetical protein [Hyalangium minutum]KFE61077.1 hypothetical protein DB31_4512 [Hyalangium minutum]